MLRIGLVDLEVVIPAVTLFDPRSLLEGLTQIGDRPGHPAVGRSRQLPLVSLHKSHQYLTRIDRESRMTKAVPDLVDNGAIPRSSAIVAVFIDQTADRCRICC